MNGKYVSIFVVGLLAVGLFAGVSKGDEISELKAQLQQLQDRIEAMEKQQKEQLNAVEKKQEEKDAELSKQIAEVASQKSTQVAEVPDSLKWAENIKIGGDFRYRHEYIDDDTKSDDRNRNRIRARVKIDGKVNDDLDFSMRVASGSEDPVSTNETLDGGFSSKDLWIDRAYLKYHGFKNVDILAGKMGNPFMAVGKNQLIWDGDLNPEGGAMQFDFDLNKDSSMFVNLGGMWVEENSSDVDQSLFGGQIGVVTAMGDGTLTAGMGYFDYGNLEDQLAVYDKEDAFGNTHVTNPDSTESYIYDYNLVEAFAAYDFKAGDAPVSVYGDYVKNIASGVQEDTGWLVGLKYGKAKAAGTWDAGYNYRDLEADAVVGAFSDSDFIGGGTDGKGHKFTFNYAIAKNFTTGVTYLMNEKGDAETDYDRLQLDFKLKF
ncbi:MAG: putative porin [Sedimentisphaeraceae bacterium JB056]